MCVHFLWANLLENFNFGNREWDGSFREIDCESRRQNWFRIVSNADFGINGVETSGSFITCLVSDILHWNSKMLSSYRLILQFSQPIPIHNISVYRTSYKRNRCSFCRINMICKQTVHTEEERIDRAISLFIIQCCMNKHSKFNESDF